MNNLSEKEYKIIENELRAFKGNIMNSIVIFKNKHNKCYYIYLDSQENIDRYKDTQDYVVNNNNKYIYRVETIQELKGWLYGVVQVKNSIL